MIDEKVMTHIAQHSDQLFIIFDGYDEYKDHNELLGDFEGQFENDTKTKMPVAALISKVIQRKILRDSVIIITSRPGEADELDKKLQFDRCVEITGFSDEQVLQYVEKYFNSKPEEVKKMAMEKVRATAHYMSFGRVPLRCLFVCQVIEYEIQNNITRDNSIPLKVTQFYCEVIRCLERNNREIRSLDEEAMLLAVEKTLDNFSKLAAQLAEQNRFTFSQKDLKKLKLPEVEISYLKSSNLIFCYPVASDSPFPQSTLEYSFSHLSIQEFFVACHLVKKRAMAAQETSDMVHIFTSGLLGLDQENNNDKCMSKVLKSVCKQGMGLLRQRVVLLRCLHEYGLEKEFTRQELTTNRDYRYWNSGGWIGLGGVTDTDCDVLAMLLESTATSISSPPDTLFIVNSQITITMLNRLLSSLHSNSTITVLGLRSCSLNDDHVKCLCNHFNNTHITSLSLSHNNITDVGVHHIVHNIASKITFLDLQDNPVSVEVSKSSEQFCQDNYPGLEFYI
ncbi:NACHT, LRR and PYD domains-containing protein 12 [Exaiptasia diaphana]|uniref:NACHT domain-containing protein n=1 Tax=Exaiptasia diaphana TaxID=2652724 RepID=A0A913Y8W4_EXADI|nr:NACHT, LRR and PYD domains-containing protein 12 [Exaiptasia diaphana]